MKHTRWLLGFLLCLLLCLALPVRAEISANLRVQETRTKIKYNGSRVRMDTSTFLDLDGQPAMAEDLGYATVRSIYNRKPRVIRMEYLDLNDALVCNRDGYAIVTQSWDGVGRMLSRAYWDENEQPVLGPEGYHSIRYVYDHLLLIREEHYGTDGLPLRSDTLYAMKRNTYEKKRAVLVEYLDEIGRAHV